MDWTGYFALGTMIFMVGATVYTFLSIVEKAIKEIK